MLTQGINLAAAKKYDMLWDIHFPTLVEMVARCVQGGIQADYALSLLSRYFGSEAVDFLSRKAALTPPHHLKDLAGTIISRYSMSNESQMPIISVSLFGRFKITVNGITIPDKEWKTKKISGILKFLLVHRKRPMPKDRLMDEFWPGVDKKHASLSFRAAQHELKKVLRKYGVIVDEEPIFLNEKRDSLSVRNTSMLVVDVDLFLAYVQELKMLHPHQGGGEQKKSILEKMLALYQGDLLEEELYDDWAFAEREELKSIYFSSAMELAHIYSEKGAGREAEKLFLKILAMDPFSEEACLNLLRLYMATNQKGRAAKLYTKFVQRFEKELQIKPDQRLSAVLQDKA